MRRVKIAIALTTAACLFAGAVGATAASAAFDITTFTGLVANQDGTTASQAASHPYSATTTFQVPALGFLQPEEAIKNVDLDLPPGFVANPQATPTKCTAAQLYEGGGNLCPSSSQVGTSFAYVAFGSVVPFYYAGVYNMVPPPGVPAMLGFVVGVQPIFIVPHLRSDGDYGLTAHVESITQFQPVVGSTVTLWGDPSDPSHDTDRGTWPGGIVGGFFQPPDATPCSKPDLVGEIEAGCHNAWPADAPKVPFLTNPGNCAAGPLSTTLRVTSWQHPNDVKTATIDHDANGNPAAVTGCDNVPFEPAISAAPTTNQADSPTGLEADISMPTEGLLDPDGIAQANLKKAVVTLPAGMTVNPSSAAGLGACSSAQIGLTTPIGATPIHFTAEPDDCPGSARIGTVKVDTPLLGQPLVGSVYLASQNDNPFGSLLAIYVTIDDPTTGIVVKLPGRVVADPQTGRLTATFDDNPQVPFEDFRVDFFGGPRASLKTPATCGAFTTVTEMTPWSAPETANATPSGSFEITQGAGGAACLKAEPEAPNGPSFSAGTVDPTAAAYTPFVFKLARADGTQQIKAIDATLPKGLLGKLAGIPYCPDGALASAQGRSGRSEQGSPSCPAASQVGSVTVGAGAGSTPLYVGAKAYLAGPYKGAPLSLAIVTPAVAGPFDLGNVVVRTALNVNPESTQIHAVSDPLPTILQGIPLDVRSVVLRMDKPDFTLNPTSCNPMSVDGSATSVFDQVASLSNPFQVGECAGLGFKPKLAIKLKGGTKRSDYPALRATVTYPKGGAYANIARATVALPHSEFLAQSHIKTICTRVQFAAEQCPPGSVYGSARAFSPLIDKPLEGPVYLRSSSNPLPDLVVSLGGQIDVDLVGRIDSVKGGIRTSFESVPDAPVSKFVLEMKGGKKGLLENSRNLCKSVNKATVQMEAQNGKAHDFEAVVANSCKKKHKRHGKPQKKG